MALFFFLKKKTLTINLTWWGENQHPLRNLDCLPELQTWTLGIFFTLQSLCPLNSHNGLVLPFKAILEMTGTVPEHDGFIAVCDPLTGFTAEPP